MTDVSEVIDTAPAAPLVIDGYDDVEPVGTGGVGDVYRAVRRSTGAVVAIKVLRPVSVGSGERPVTSTVAWHRCRRELTALVALGGHAHVVAVNEVLDLPEGPALVMEFAPGGSVAGLVARRGAPLQVAEVALVARHTAEALAAAGSRGIVHRDVKPHNLLIDAFGQVKLCDFGVAALARSTDFQARTNAVSLRYASPEDLEDDGEVGPPSDIYSLGATLLFLTHGVHLELRDRLVPWAPPPPEGIPEPGLARLDELIAWCLQPQPVERPSAGEVLDALDRVEADVAQRCRALPVHTAPGGEPPPPAFTVARPLPGRTDRLREPRRPDAARTRLPRPVKALTGVTAAVVVGLAASWWVSRSGTPPSDGPAIGARAGEVDVVERPAGLVDMTALDWPLGPVGECLVQEAGVSTLVVVPCAHAHDLERVATGRLTERAATAELCVRAATSYTGGTRSDLGLGVSSTAPSEAGWAAGDRSYQCWVGVPGHRLVNSVAQTGQRGQP